MTARQTRIHEPIGWGVMMVGVLLVIAYRLPFGFHLEDEGFYLAVPARYLLGDLPFRDERYTILRNFDLVTAPLMQVVGARSVLFWRWFGFAMQLLLLVATLPLMRRLVGPKLAIPLVAALALFAPFNLWTLNYNSLGVGACGAAIALWLYSSLVPDRRSVLAAIAGGLTFGVACIVYAPMSVLGTLVLTGVLIREFRRVSLIWLAAWLGSLLLALLLLLANGWAQQVPLALNDLRSLPQYDGGLLQRAFDAWFGPGARQSSLIAFLTGGIAGALAAGPGRARRLALPLLLAVAALTASLAWDDSIYKTTAPHLLALNVAFVSAALGFAVRRYMMVGASAARRAAVFWMAGAIFCALVLAASSVARAPQANVGAWMLWPASVALVSTHSESNDHETRGSFVALILVLGMMAAAGWHLFSWVYWNPPIPELTAKPNAARLRGLRLHPDYARTLDSVIYSIEQRTDAGDYVLDLAAPGITYLTGTRPMLPSVYGISSDAVAERWLAWSITQGRTAAVAVTKASADAPAPLLRYVVDHYEPVTRAGEFTVWARRPAAGGD